MAAMAALALPCCCSSSALLDTAIYHTTPRSTTSLKALPTLPGLRRSREVNGVSGVVKPGRRGIRGPSALFGGGGKSDGKKPEKKFITKEEEPEQYWQTAAEKEGKNPMQTLLPYIFILTLLTPFAILAVAFANNWIKLPNQ